MFLNDDADILKLIKAVRNCKEDVYLLTEEGDNLNLKSTLCQYAVVAMVAKPEILVRAQIKCSNDVDKEMLSEFMHD